MGDTGETKELVSRVEPITDALLDSLTPDEKGIVRYRGRRFFKTADVWRTIPKAFPDINPTRYTPVQPFTLSKSYNNKGKEVRKTFDANGMRLRHDGSRVALNFYPAAASYAAFEKAMIKPNECGRTKIYQRREKQFNIMLYAFRGDERAKKYFGKDGRPNPETIQAFLLYAFQCLLAQPSMSMSLLQDITDKWQKNPLATYEQCLRLFGYNTTTNIIAQNVTQNFGPSIAFDASEREAELAKLIDGEGGELTEVEALSPSRPVLPDLFEQAKGE